MGPVTTGFPKKPLTNDDDDDDTSDGHLQEFVCRVFLVFLPHRSVVVDR